jgi:hypothetical protein
VVYVEQPNQVSFKSNTLVKGVIVVDNKKVGTSATNRITFDSNVKVTGMGGLPPPTANPALDPFPAAMRALTGSSILAPNFHMHFNSNFAVTGGSIVGGSMYFDSNANATIQGAVIALENKPMQMNGNSTLTFDFSNPALWPAGMYFRSSYSPRHGTYREFDPGSEGM